MLNNLISNPTPDEINWINAEDEATKHELLSTRRINLVDSTEFQKYKLKNYLTAIITSLRMIIGSDNLKDELYWWGNLSSLLIDEQTLNDALYTLKINGKFPSEIGRLRNLCIGTGDRSADYNMCYHSFGEGILSYILIPYLQMKV